MIALSAHFVLHTLKSNSHVDLFIKINKDFLHTYELHYDFYAYYRKHRRDFYLNQRKIIMFRIDQTPPRYTTSFLLHKKKHHRNIYWTYRGPLSDNRGSISEIIRNSVYIHTPSRAPSQSISKEILYLSLEILPIL